MKFQQEFMKSINNAHLRQLKSKESQPTKEEAETSANKDD